MFFRMVQAASNAALPLVILAICAFGYSRKVKIYEAFIEGAKEGFTTAIRLLPFLVAIFVAIGVFREGGAMEITVKLLSPVTSFIGIPVELIPLAIIRPLSGTGSMGVTSSILHQCGADSLIGKMASTMQASCETTFYVISIYLGAVGIRKARHTILVGLLVEFIALVASVLFWRLVSA